MTRRVFFSFHYENDVWRANIVRNSWVTKEDRTAAGFIDAADFEEVKKGGDVAIKKWIDNQLLNTSVTVVLIGQETSNREYVQYELKKSYERGNGILGIYIHQLKDQNGKNSLKGANTFGEIGKDSDGKSIYLSINFPCYDWIDDNGYSNLGKWIDDAAKIAGK